MKGLLIVAVFIGLPWLILHYVTKWKTTPALSDNDADMLEELYQLARRLDERMETVERLVAAESPDFAPPRLVAEQAKDSEQLEELERMMTERHAR